MRKGGGGENDKKNCNALYCTVDFVHPKFSSAQTHSPNHIKINISDLLMHNSSSIVSKGTFE